MEKKISLLIWIPMVIIALSLAGFYRSYLSHFPKFSNFGGLIHIHFLAFSGWFALMLVQPILIRKKQFEKHKTLGKLSYLLIPVLILTIALLRLKKLPAEVADSLPDASMNAFITFLDMLSLAGFYAIAVINSKNLRWHVAFILATSLVILNPGLARLLNLIKPGLGMSVILIPFIFTSIVFLYEKFRYKRSILKSPYFMIFILWLLEIILLLIIPGTLFWQKLILELSKIS
ncbi:MAG: hypothetical protein BGO40_01730 [Chryseobacterium sp. 39-10]|nr:hypothetical protein [Chryseobacterium sp.]OJV48540.1 MAG: hypothetical protein BGO40_01730 [Chryseobacterium sp. 39-10]